MRLKRNQISRYLTLLLFAVFTTIANSQTYSIEKVVLPKHLYSNCIHKVFTDHYGNLLIAGEKGVFKWNGFAFTEISGFENFEDYSAFNIWEDKSGIIWMNTFGEKIINYYDGDIFQTGISKALSTTKVNSSTQDINGNYWFGDHFGNIFLINSENKIKINKEPGKEKIHRIHRIEPLKNGNVIAALTFGSFYLLNKKGVIIKKLDWKHDYNWGPANVFCLKNGKVILSNQHGIHLYSSNLILEKSILFDNTFKGYISDIQENKDGILWIGSKFGLYSLDQNNFSINAIKPVLNNQYINSISIGAENNIWVATNSNGLIKIIETYKTPLINTINQKALNALPHDTVKRYRISVALFDPIDSTIWWAGSEFLGNFNKGKNYHRRYGSMVILDPKSMVMDNKRHLWLGGEGLLIFDTKTLKLNSYSSLKSVKVQDCKIINKYIVVATRNHGVYFIDNYKIVSQLNANNFLFSDNCLKILPTSGGMYLKIENHIFKYELTGTRIDNATLINFDFGNLNIVKILETNSAYQCYTADTVISVPKERLHYPVEMSFKSNSRWYSTRNLNRIRYHLNETQIHFSSPSFNNQELLFYRYKFKKSGQSSKWTKTRYNEVILYALEPGTYEFVLQNSLDKFNWSNSRVLQFEIIPPFTKTLWFKLIIAILVLGVIFLIFRDRLLLEKNKRQIAEVKLKLLQSQMNPHFIFNSLNSIQQFIFSNDVEKSNYYLSRFSKLMRNCYDYAGKQSIRVQDEIKFLENYLEIEMLRFGKKFTYSIETADDVVLSDSIPPLVMQPIVENAIKHGFQDLVSGGIIKITFQQDDDLIKVSVYDNGVGFYKEGKPINESSIFNIKERFELLRKSYKNQKIDLVIDPSINEGTLVIITLPVLESY